MLIIVVSILVFACVGILVWAVYPNPEHAIIRQRIMSQVTEVQRPTIISQVASMISPLHRRLPTATYCTAATKKLEAAGMRMPPLHLLVIQELGLVGGVAFYFATMGANGINLFWLVTFAVLGFMVPALWIRNRIKGRRMTVARDLPEIVDLLTLCVSAGGDFMSSLNRIVREFRPCPVREELGYLIQEVRVGKRRRDALRAFAARLQTAETSTFARTLIQVDRMGTGMSEALNILSEDMRLQRYHWAERFAQQAPMKMLLPLIVSLGAAMIIVAGPILMQFFRGGLMSTPKMTAEGAQGLSQGTQH